MMIPEAESYWVIDASHEARSGRFRFIRLYRQGNTAHLLSHDEKCNGWFLMLSRDGEMFHAHQPESIMADMPARGLVLGLYSPATDMEAIEQFRKDNQFHLDALASRMGDRFVANLTKDLTDALPIEGT